MASIQSSKLLINSLTTELSAALIAQSNDISLVIDSDGVTVHLQELGLEKIAHDHLIPGRF